MKRLYYKPTNIDTLAWPFPAEPVNLPEHYRAFLPDGRLLYKQSSGYLNDLTNDPGADAKLRRLASALLAERPRPAEDVYTRTIGK
jgi:hypothetical protein